MLNKKFQKVLALFLALVMLVAILPSSAGNQVFAAYTEENVIYQNDFETDAGAVSIGVGNKALEFNVTGDVTNSWVSVFQQDLNYSYAEKINSGLTLSFDLLLPTGSTYTGLLKAQAVTKMGDAWAWTQSSTIPDINISKFTDSGKGYLKTNVSIPFGSEIEAIQGLKSIVPCLAASNCDYIGKIYLDNVKLKNGITQPVEPTIIYENNFETGSETGVVTVTGTAIGIDNKVLEFNVAGDVTNSWVPVFQRTLSYNYAEKLYSGATLSFELLLPSESTFTGYLKPQAVTQMGDSWTWTQSTTIPTISIGDFADLGNGYKIASVAIPFGKEIEAVQGLKAIIPCLVASNCDYIGKIYLDSVKLVNGVAKPVDPQFIGRPDNL
jgi:mannan endo-1,4-beta-mannosidase